MNKGVLASNTVAMVTYCVTKMITTCSPMVGQFFDTMIVKHQVITNGCNDPSKYKCWKLFRATLNYFCSLLTGKHCVANSLLYIVYQHHKLISSAVDMAQIFHKVHSLYSLLSISASL